MRKRLKIVSFGHWQSSLERGPYTCPERGGKQVLVWTRSKSLPSVFCFVEFHGRDRVQIFILGIFFPSLSSEGVDTCQIAESLFIFSSLFGRFSQVRFRTGLKVGDGSMPELSEAGN